MKNSIILYILILSSFPMTANVAQKNGIGKVWPGENKTWIDDSTKYEITQWTTTGKNWHLYFNIESFIDENNAIIYSDRAGAVNLFKLNLSNGTITQLTDHTTDVSGAVWHYPKLKQIWYEVDNSIRVLNYETLVNKLVIKNSSADLKSFTVTCDAKYLVFSVNKNPGYSSNNSTGPYAIMRFDLVTEEVKQISPDSVSKNIFLNGDDFRNFNKPFFQKVKGQVKVLNNIN